MQRHTQSGKYSVLADLVRVQYFLRGEGILLSDFLPHCFGETETSTSYYFFLPGQLEIATEGRNVTPSFFFVFSSIIIIVSFKPPMSL